MATGWLSKHIHAIDLLLRSGVLRQSNTIILPQPGLGLASLVAEEEYHRVLVYNMRNLGSAFENRSCYFRLWGFHD
ncbi:hypothetical protein LguiB_022190 [Lonicera macranthoides]